MKQKYECTSQPPIGKPCHYYDEDCKTTKHNCKYQIPLGQKPPRPKHDKIVKLGAKERKLKHCPFCGRNAFIQESKDAWYMAVIQIGCETSECKGSLYFGRYWGDDARKEAIAAWNTRVKK